MKPGLPFTDLPEGTVTFLFTDIEGSTELLKQLGDEYATLLSEQREILRETFALWNGQEVDTQGDSFFVSFPRATQAVSAAVDVQRTLHDHKWPDGVHVRLRMGVHTGEPLSWDEGYVGIDVHRAARIAHVGHGGQVLLSETATALVRDDLPDGVTLLDLGRHRLKDMHRPERICQLAIERLPSEFPALKSLEALPPEVPIDLGSVKLPAFLEKLEEPPASVFVGRDRELKLLEGFLDQALEGRGQVVFLTGDPGRGKTALLNAFARGAMDRHPDLLVASGECSAYTGVGDPYHPFRGVMGMLTGDLETQWAAGRLTSQQSIRLWEGMPRVSRALVEHGQDLVDVFVSGRELLARVRSALEGSADWLERLATLTEQERPLPGELEQRNLFEQIEDVFAETGEEHPLLIILDDLQWSDKASINLLFHLGRRLLGRRILIVGAYRPEEITLGRGGEKHPLEPVLAEFKRLHGDIWIDLSAITEDEEHRFIKAYLDSEPNRLSEGFRRALYDHTNGHPLFTVELLRNLQERGDLVKDEEELWIEGPALNWGVLPARVEGVIEERIGRLKEELRETLTIASVEGEDFTSQVVAGVQQVGERKLLKRLSRELEKQHRLVKARGESKVGTHILSQFQFSHVLFQRFLYNDLGTGERRLLHGEVAVALEDLYGEEKDNIAVQLAYHFANAEEADKAIHYLQLAGDKARLAYAHQEAIDYYNRALALQKEQGYDDEAARTLMKLGMAYHYIFDFPSARQAYDEGCLLWQRASVKDLASSLPPSPHAFRFHSTEPLSLDSTMAMDVVSMLVIRQIFSGLLDLTPEMDVVPDVAQSWDVLEDGRKYVFHIRNDVRWSDGIPVTARDFEYAWKRVLDPTTESQVAFMLYDVKGAMAYHQGDIYDSNNVGVQAMDETTLLVELEEPIGHFPYLLTHSVTFPIPRHVVEKYGEKWPEVGNIVTNGPFKVESWQPGKSMVLVSNEDYQRRIGGNLQMVELQLISIDDLVQAEEYESDNLDVINLWGLIPEKLDRMKHLHFGEYVSTPIPSTWYFGFNATRPPFDNPSVRQAFVMATDRMHFLQGALSLYPPPSGGFVPPGVPGHSPEIGLAHDPKRAQQLMAEAGYPDGDGFPVIEIIFPTGGDQGDAQLLHKKFFQTQWHEHLGIESKWEFLEFKTLLSRLQSERPDMYFMGWNADYPDPYNFLTEASILRNTGWRDDVYDMLLEKSRRVQDQDERLNLLQEADRILMEEAPIMPLYYGRSHLLVKPWVKRYVEDWKDVILEPH